MEISPFLRHQKITIYWYKKIFHPPKYESYGDIVWALCKVPNFAYFPWHVQSKPVYSNTGFFLLIGVFWKILFPWSVKLSYFVLIFLVFF